MDSSETGDKDSKEKGGNEEYISALFEARVAEEVRKIIREHAEKRCARVRCCFDALIVSIRNAFEQRSHNFRMQIADLHGKPSVESCVESGIRWKYEDVLEMRSAIESVLNDLKSIRERSRQLNLCRNAALFFELARVQTAELNRILDTLTCLKRRASELRNLHCCVGEAKLTFDDSRSIDASRRLKEVVANMCKTRRKTAPPLSFPSVRKRRKQHSTGGSVKRPSGTSNGGAKRRRVDDENDDDFE